MGAGDGQALVEDQVLVVGPGCDVDAVAGGGTDDGLGEGAAGCTPRTAIVAVISPQGGDISVKTTPTCLDLCLMIQAEHQGGHQDEQTQRYLGQRKLAGRDNPCGHGLLLRKDKQLPDRYYRAVDCSRYEGGAQN
jgi:hypothetical protein